MPNFTLHQIKIVLLAFVAIYAVLGIILIIVSQVTKSNLYGAVKEHDLSYDVGGKVQSIDVSLGGTWLIITSFWIWGIVILVFSAYGAISIVLEKPTHVKVFAFLLLIVSSMKISVIAYTMYLCGQWDSIMVFSKTSLEGNFLLTATDKDSKAAFDFVQEWLGFTLTMLCAIKLTIGCLFLITAQYPVEVKSRLQKNFNHYLDNGRCEAAQTFIEEEHECCGIVNYTDYIYLNMSQEPKSCFQYVSEAERMLMRDGCAVKVKNYYMDRITDIGLICLLVGSLEVFGPISTFFLANSMRGSSPNTDVPTFV